MYFLLIAINRYTFTWIVTKRILSLLYLVMGEKRERERERERETDRQTDRQTERERSRERGQKESGEEKNKLSMEGER